MQGAPPPSPPELPEGLNRRPRWPARYAAYAFLAGPGPFLLLGLLGELATSDESDTSSSLSAGAVIVSVLVLDTVLLGVALFFASRVRSPRAWHFGLNRTTFWAAVGWASLAFFTFLLFGALYQALLDPEVEQGVTEALGADEGTFGLIMAGFMVIAVAPVIEEVFFRGFLYRALRSRFGVLSAAAIDGVLFGIVHHDYTAEGWLIVPPLGVLGFIFCLVYERTGSLFPVIGLHAFNNALAYGVQTDGDGTPVSVALGLVVIAGCALVPRLMRPAPATA